MRLRAVALTSLIIGLFLFDGLASAAPAATSAPARGKVLILSVPTLTWEDVEENRLPAIESLLRQSAVGSLSVRAIGARTDIDEAYATFGAGNRARGIPFEGGYAAESDEQLAEGLAGEVFGRRTGAEVEDAAVVHLGAGPLYRANNTLNYGAKLGALGGALRAAGMSAAVVANADLGPNAPNQGVYRPAVAAVMDREGRVHGGRVSDEIVDGDPQAPFGVRLSVDAAATAASEAWEDSDVLLVEASDLVRAFAWRPWAYQAPVRRARAEALVAADRLAAAVLHLAGPDDLVLLVSPFAGVQERLTVAAARGPRLRPLSLLSSPSTRRAGYVALTDLGPTVLEHVGVGRPNSMTGRAIGSGRDTSTLAKRVRQLADADAAARFRDKWQTPFVVLYIVMHAVLFVVAMALFWRREQPPRPRWLRLAALVLLALPVTTYLLGALPVWRWGGPVLFALVILIASLLAGLSLLASRVPLGPPMSLAALTVAVLIADVLLGAKLQINTLFGYSPIVAGRFQGYGNTAFSLLAVCTILVATWMVCLLGKKATVQVAMAVLFAVALVADGAPSLGSDVGGILATVPAYGLAFILLSGRRINRVMAASLAASAVAVLVLAAGIDLARPEADRTHLGRLVESTRGGGLQSLFTVIERKAKANLSVLTHSTFTYLVPFLVAFLAVLLRRPGRLMGEIVERYPSLRPGIYAALLAAVLGFALNDSGVAVPAVMLAVLETVLLYCVTALPERKLGPAHSQVG